MLKLKTTFEPYIDEMENQIKKSISDKLIRRIAECILDEMTEAETIRAEIGEGSS